MVARSNKNDRASPYTLWMYATTSKYPATGGLEQAIFFQTAPQCCSHSNLFSPSSPHMDHALLACHVFKPWSKLVQWYRLQWRWTDLFTYAFNASAKNMTYFALFVRCSQITSSGEDSTTWSRRSASPWRIDSSTPLRSTEPSWNHRNRKGVQIRLQRRQGLCLATFRHWLKKWRQRSGEMQVHFRTSEVQQPWATWCWSTKMVSPTLNLFGQVGDCIQNIGIEFV